MSANWTVDASTIASGALATGGTITIISPASTTFPSAISAYKVRGTTVIAIPTTVISPFIRRSRIAERRSSSA
jgi:hypothetical protein